MSSNQIDKLCRDWLREHYGEGIASEYKPESLVINAYNSPDLSEGLEDLKHELCLAFGPDISFGTTDYLEARTKLGLDDEQIPIPELFCQSFYCKL